MTLYYKTRGERRADGREFWYAYHWSMTDCWPFKWWLPLEHNFACGGGVPVGTTAADAREACQEHAAKIFKERAAVRGAAIVEHLKGDRIAIEEKQP